MRKLVNTVPIILFVAAACAIVQAQYQPDPKERECLSNMKHLGLAMVMYSQDWDGKLPPMRSTAKFQKSIAPYVRSRTAYICPSTNAPYAPVGALSGKAVKSIKATATTVAIQDSRPHVNGWKTVAYVDGHAKMVKAGTPRKR